MTSHLSLTFLSLTLAGALGLLGHSLRGDPDLESRLEMPPGLVHLEIDEGNQRHSASRGSSHPGRAGDRDGEISVGATASHENEGGSAHWADAPCYGFQWVNHLTLSLGIYPSRCGGLPGSPPRLKWRGELVDDQRHGLWRGRDAKGKVRRERCYRLGVLVGLARDWDSTGALDAEWQMADGRRHGFYRCFHRNGRLRAGGQYVQGHRDGGWRFVWENGAENLIHYARGVRHGREQDMDAEGRLRFEGHWNRNRPAGTFLRFYASGQIEEKAEYARGGLHGWWRRWHLDGSLAAEGRALNNRPVGLWQSWHENGRRWARRFFVAGRAEGVYELWNEAGVLVDRSHYRAGELHGAHERWDDEGRQEQLRTYAFGMLHGVERTWDLVVIEDEATEAILSEMHTLVSECHYHRGERHGLELSWHSNGQLADSTLYAHGQFEGLSRSYDESGQILTEVEYVAGQKEGQERTWFANGELATQVHWRHGSEVGVQREWDDTGRLRVQRELDENEELIGNYLIVDAAGVVAERGRWSEGEKIGLWIESEVDAQDRVVTIWRQRYGPGGEAMGEREIIEAPDDEDPRLLARGEVGIYRCHRVMR